MKIFISSPGDVGPERAITERVLNRLAEEFSGLVKLEPIFWEHEPMRATQTFQKQIISPAETDIFICILWSRIGTRLPKTITREDGSIYQSGTEYEFEDALEGFKKTGRPEIFIYLKTAKPLLDPDSPDFETRLHQKRLLDEFCQHWFRDEDGAFTGAFNPFDDLEQFEDRLEIHLQKQL